MPTLKSALIVFHAFMLSVFIWCKEKQNRKQLSTFQFLLLDINGSTGRSIIGVYTSSRSPFS